MTAGSGQRFGQGEIRAFTGLRGCAAVMVMLYHFTLNMPYDTMPGRRFLLNGYLWVDLFFVLSGFVMAYSQAAAFVPGRRSQAYLAFLTSRIARVYPLYALVLIESACLVLWRTPDLDVQAFARVFALNLVMIQAWGLAPSLEGAAWSISTEWGAYLLFPLLLAATASSSRRMAWLTATAAVSAILYLALSPGPFGTPGQSRGGPLDIYGSVTAAPLLRCLAEFILGLVAFRAARHVAAHRHAWTGPAALAAMMVILIAMNEPDLDVIIVVLFAILLVTLAPGTGLLARLLGTWVPYTLGQWSYSIYLIHDKFSHPAGSLQKMLGEHMPFASVAAAAIMVCVVIACSAATFLWVERPLRDWLLRKTRTLRPRAGETASRSTSIPAAPNASIDALS